MNKAKKYRFTAKNSAFWDEAASTVQMPERRNIEIHLRENIKTAYCRAGQPG
jgi:hypothetical protein